MRRNREPHATSMVLDEQDEVHFIGWLEGGWKLCLCNAFSTLSLKTWSWESGDRLPLFLIAPPKRPFFDKLSQFVFCSNYRTVNTISLMHSPKTSLPAGANTQKVIVQEVQRVQVAWHTLAHLVVRLMHRTKLKMIVRSRSGGHLPRLQRLTWVSGAWGGSGGCTWCW